MCQRLQDLHNSLQLCLINERCLLMLQNQPWGKYQFIDIDMVRACPLQIVSIRGKKKKDFPFGMQSQRRIAKIIGKDKNVSPFKTTQQCESIFFIIYFYQTIYLIRVDKESSSENPADFYLAGHLSYLEKYKTIPLLSFVLESSYFHKIVLFALLFSLF